MSSPDRPLDPLTPEGQASPPVPDRSTLHLSFPQAETPPAASGSIYEQPTIIGSQAFQPPSGPLPQPPGYQPLQAPSGPLPQASGQQPWPSFASGPTAPDAQPFQPLSGPIAPAAGLMPVMMPSGPLPQPTAPPVVGSSSRSGFRWALAFALFGLVLAIAGGVFFLLIPGPSPAFASEQHNWVVNPVIGLPTVIVGLLLLVVPFVLPVALKPLAQKAGQAGTSMSPAQVGAAASSGAAPIGSAPMGSAPLMAGSQPWLSFESAPTAPDAQPFQPSSGPLPPLPDVPDGPPAGTAEPSQEPS